MNITLSGQGDTRPNRRLLAAGRLNVSRLRPETVTPQNRKSVVQNRVFPCLLRVT